MRAPSVHRLTLRRAAALAVLAAVAIGAAAGSASGDLSSRIGAARAHERSLQSSIGADSSRIRGFQGTIDDLQQRLTAIQSSLDIERAQLFRLQAQLRSARARLLVLRTRFAESRRVLAAQLVGQYKAPDPDIVTVILNSDGFAQLVERVDQLKRIARQNLETTVSVRDARDAVDRQAGHLAGLEANQERVTTAVLVQRDQVGQLRLAMVARQLVFVRARSHKSSELAVLREHRQTLERRLSAIQAKEAAAQARSTLGAVPGIGGGFSGGGGGSYGFFQAPGTNYSFGSEPELAARLDRLGKALHLHLIGISGYRTPSHSVEVGGFANDPHTRGEASDTPGIEGVPEAVLNRFGLTRPFPGAAEADHIQLA